MARSRVIRFVAFFAVATTLIGCSSVAPSDAAEPIDATADGRWGRPPTKGPRTTTTAAPRATTTGAPATTSTAAPTTAAPTTTSTTTTTTVPSGDRCSQVRASQLLNRPRFSLTSTFNQPAACLSTRTDSHEWADRWFRNANFPGRTNPAERGAINVSFDAYSSPVYDVRDATTFIRVYTASWGYGHNLGANRSIPWNPTWEPASGNDLEMIILDNSTGVEWALWGVQKINWTSCFTLENLLTGYQPGTDLCVATAAIGKNPDGTLSDAVNSSGFSQSYGRGMGAVLGMSLLPTLDEIENGSINHAVNMETYGTMFGPGCTSSQISAGRAGLDCGYAVAPATRLEWYAGPASMCGPTAPANTPEARALTVPEGMRFALNLTDAEIDQWLDSRGYTGAKRRTARIFAVALRDYGWIISDTTCWDSSMAVEGVANPKARQRWADLGITNPVGDGTSLLDGLITSSSQVRTLSAPHGALLVNSQ